MTFARRLLPTLLALLPGAAAAAPFTLEAGIDRVRREGAAIALPDAWSAAGLRTASARVNGAAAPDGFLRAAAGVPSETYLVVRISTNLPDQSLVDIRLFLGEENEETQIFQTMGEIQGGACRVAAGPYPDPLWTGTYLLISRFDPVQQGDEVLHQLDPRRARPITGRAVLSAGTPEDREAEARRMRERFQSEFRSIVSAFESLRSTFQALSPGRKVEPWRRWIIPWSRPIRILASHELSAEDTIVSRSFGIPREAIREIAGNLLSLGAIEDAAIHTPFGATADLLPVVRTVESQYRERLRAFSDVAGLAPEWKNETEALLAAFEEDRARLRGWTEGDGAPEAWPAWRTGCEQRLIDGVMALSARFPASRGERIQRLTAALTGLVADCGRVVETPAADTAARTTAAEAYRRSDTALGDLLSRLREELR